jgi:hypothetical protein
MSNLLYKKALENLMVSCLFVGSFGFLSLIFWVYSNQNPKGIELKIKTGPYIFLITEISFILFLLLGFVYLVFLILKYLNFKNRK